jgi:hypothetical protein
MSAISEFRRQLTEAAARRGLSVRTWSSGGRHSANLFELTTTPEPTVLYVKEFNVPNKPGFWGLTKNQIDRLESAAPHWFAVLLLRSFVAGYVLTAAEVRHRVADGSFELSDDCDFKVNETADLNRAQSFGSISQLLDRLV